MPFEHINIEMFFATLAFLHTNFTILQKLNFTCTFSMCCIKCKYFMATFLAFNGDTTIGVTPDPISRIMAYCNNFCFETL